MRRAPLSLAQERLWVLDRLQPHASVYNVPVVLDLRGPLDEPALAATLNVLVDRHEALRTTISVIDGTPCQLVGPAREPILAFVDVAGTDAAAREAEAHRLAAAEIRRPFDLDDGSLFRASLLRVGPDMNVLVLTLHHIICDAWSLAIIAADLTELYAAATAGRDPVLPPTSRHYADYAAEQRRLLAEGNFDRQLAFWKQRLHGLPTIELPTDRPRPPVQTFRGTEHRIVIEPELVARLKEFAHSEQATLFMVVLASLFALVGRYSDEDDIAVGSVVAGRSEPELGQTVGFFVNTVVLRGDLSGRPSFRELLARTRRCVLDALENADAPFEQVVTAVAPDRDPSRNPLFQVMLAMQTAPHVETSFDGVDTRRVEIESGSAKFDLTFNCWEQLEGLIVHISFNLDLFDRRTIERLGGHLLRLITAVANHPQRPFDEIPLIDEHERRTILGWNRPYVLNPDTTLHGLVEERADATPDAVAVVAGDETLSFGELDQRANALAKRLAGIGVATEDVVAVCLPRGADAIVALLGILKSGAAYLPLDPSYPPRRQRLMLDDSAAAAVVSRSDVTFVARDQTPLVLVNGDEPDKCDERFAPQATPANLAYVIYTSGSTGIPKGVEIEHRGAVNFVLGIRVAFGIRGGDRILQFASLGFDASVLEIFSALTAGATVVVADDDQRLDAVALATFLRSTGVTVALLPPSLLRSVPTDVRFDLRTLAVGGERCTRDLVDRWAADTCFLNAYGPTEITVCATVADSLVPGEEPPLGRPIRNTSVFVLDRLGQPVPIGVAGEIHVGGAGVGRGYRGQPALTAERFVPNPFTADGSRLYATGDIGRFRVDGKLEFLGRRDDQVKIRGHRIELGEVEAALRTVANGRQSAVLATEDPNGGHELVAVLERGPQRELPPWEVRERLRDIIPAFMVPSRVVWLDALPRLPNRKLDRANLVELTSVGVASGVLRQPTTTTERTVATIWEELLGTRQADVSMSFFDAGGHSLALVRLHERIRQRLGVELSLISLFQQSTIAEMAALCDGARAGTVAPVVVSFAAGESGARRRGVVACVHAGDGEVAAYIELAERLAPRHEVVGIRAPRGGGGDTVPALAEAALDALRCDSLEPACLVGWSLGGLIAIEMKRNLDYLPLVLVDPRLPGLAQADLRDRYPVLAALALDGIADISCCDDFTRAALARQAAAATGLAASLDSAADTDLLERLLSHFRAFANYDPPLVRGDIVLFLSTHHDRIDAAQRAWRARLPDADIKLVDATHDLLLREPQVLAELEDAIDRVVTGGRGDNAHAEMPLSMPAPTARQRSPA